MKNYSKRSSIGKMIVFGVLAATAFTFALMFLWNWLMPVIFGLTAITFWQALGLLVLSKILFGKGQRPNWQNREKSKIHKEQFMKRFGMRPIHKDEKQKTENTDEEKH